MNQPAAPGNGELLHVTRVESNYKATPDEGPGGWSYDLTRHVFLAGASGSGKSRVTDAIELAQTGQISTILGRKAVKAAKMLWRGAPEDADELFAQITMSDGRVVRWSVPAPQGTGRIPGKLAWTVDGVGVGKGKNAIEGGVFSVAAIRKNMFGSSDTAARWVCDQLGITVGVVIEHALETLKKRKRDASTRDAAIRALKAQATDATSAESVATTLDGQIKSAQRTVKERTQIADEVEDAIGGPVSEAQILEAETAVTEAEGRLAQATQDYDNHAAVLEAYRQIQAHEQVVVENDVIVNPADAPRAELAAALLPAMDAGLRLFPDNEHCLMCHTHVGVPHLHQRRVAVATVVQEHASTRDAAERRVTAEKWIIHFNAEMNQAITAIDPDTYAAMQQGTWVDGREACRTARDAAKAALIELQARAVAARAPEAQEAAIEQTKARVDALTLALRTLKASIKTKTAELLDGFTATAQSYWPPVFGVPLGLSLDSEVEVGPIQGDRIGIPSGGQSVAMLLALSAAFSDVATGIRAEDAPPEMRIIRGEDRTIDDAVMASICAALAKVNTAQVFLTGVGVPAGIPERWQVISCARSGAPTAAPVPPAAPPPAGLPELGTESAQEALARAEASVAGMEETLPSP